MQIKYLNNSILFFFTAYLAAVNFSIAVSSISFGLWILLWLYKIIFIKRDEISKEEIRFNKTIIILILIFIAWDITSRAAAGFRGPSVEGMRRNLIFLVFFFMIFSLNSKKALINIILAIIITASLISVYELIVYFSTVGDLMKEQEWGYIRISYFSYPLTQGQIKMLLLMFMLPLFFVKEKLPVSKTLLLIMFIVLFISMFLTQSRNVYLGIAASVLVYGAVKNRKLLFAFIAAVILLWFVTPEMYKSRMASIFDLNHPSNRARIVMWQTSWQIFLDYPVFGIGERFYKFEEIYSEYKTIEEENWGEGTHLHNNFYMILILNGIVGMLAFAAIFVVMFFRQIKFYKLERDPLNKALIMGAILVMISFHVAGIFDFNFRDQKIAPLFLFLVTVPFVIGKLKLQEEKNIKENN
jgi:putative inorganic carbon (hco3(-)) transporter